MRALAVSDGGEETSLETFARDHLAICRVADSRDRAELRVWRAAAPVVALGRYHRRPKGASALVRRLTGGRPYAAGAGILCMSGAYSSLAWLAGGNAALAPEQVLNRALRPLLATLRKAGVDAFYPGRDLVTAGGLPLAVASFTVLPDGVVAVSAALAANSSLSETAPRVAGADPGGVVTFDAEALERSVTLAEVGRGTLCDAICEPASGTRALADSLAEHAADAQGCNVTAVAAAGSVVDVRPAFEALQREREAPRSDERAVYAVEMLGAIEACARMDDGRIASLTLCGDLIASYATIEELSAALVGERPTRAATERALLSVLARPGRFMLGVRDLPALIARLADR